MPKIRGIMSIMVVMFQSNFNKKKKISYSCRYVNAVIEIPKGSKAKYELDKDSGLLRLDRVFYFIFLQKNIKRFYFQLSITQLIMDLSPKPIVMTLIP